MTIKEIVEQVDPDSIDIIELEEDNIYKANTNSPYIPLPEFEDLLESLVDTVSVHGGPTRALKLFLGQELSAVQSERQMYSCECAEHFDNRERKLKDWMRRFFKN
jgi:hypothetical protein